MCSDSIDLIHYAREQVVHNINIIELMTYYTLGKWIVELRLGRGGDMIKNEYSDPVMKFTNLSESEIAKLKYTNGDLGRKHFLLNGDLSYVLFRGGTNVVQ